jgi:protein gp37
MENSKIGWTTHTWNPWWGCHKIAAECKECYIKRYLSMAGHDPFDGPIKTSRPSWRKPHGWNKKAAGATERPRVFTCSMSDFFHDGADTWRAEAWETIRACKNLNFLILSKRLDLIESAPSKLPMDWGKGYDNVWLGATAGCMKTARKTLPALAKIPARLKFISVEPLLERVDFAEYWPTIDWVISGAERAGKSTRRNMELAWIEDLDRQCREAGVPHFFKQAYEGGKLSDSPHLNGEQVQEFPALAWAV